MKLWTFVSKRGWYICMSSSPSFFIISESEGLEIALLMILTCLQAVHWLWLLSTSSCNISGQNVSISWWLLWSRHYLQVLQPHQPWWSPQNSLWFNDAFHVLGELKQMQHSDGVSGVLSRVIQSLCLLCWPHCSYWCWSPQLPSPGDPGPFLHLASQSLSAQPAAWSGSLCVILGDFPGAPFGTAVLIFHNCRCPFSLELAAKVFGRESLPLNPC